MIPEQAVLYLILYTLYPIIRHTMPIILSVPTIHVYFNLKNDTMILIIEPNTKFMFPFYPVFRKKSVFRRLKKLSSIKSKYRYFRYTLSFSVDDSSLFVFARKNGNVFH